MSKPIPHTAPSSASSAEDTSPPPHHDIPPGGRWTKLGSGDGCNNPQMSYMTGNVPRREDRQDRKLKG